MNLPTRAAYCALALPVYGLIAQGVLIPLDSAPFATRAFVVNVEWTHRSTPSADFYVIKGSRAEVVANALPLGVADAVANALRILGEPAQDRRMRLFFVGSREEMRPFTNGTQGGGAIAPEAAAI